MCASICRVTRKVLDRTKRRGEISAVNQANMSFVIHELLVELHGGVLSPYTQFESESEWSSPKTQLANEALR